MDNKAENLFSSFDLEKPKGDFYFAKSEISEIAPRPSFLTFDILSELYKKNGPVCKVYKKYGVRYKSAPFLKIFGNELFVDKEKEIKSLLPAYSFFKSKNGSAKMFFQSGFFQSLKNIFFLSLIKTDQYEQLLKRLKEKLSKPETKTGFQEKLDIFLQDYEVIFEVNLLAQTSSKRLEKVLQKEKIGMMEILRNQSFFVKEKKFFLSPSACLQGNFLELGDQSSFVSFAQHTRSNSKEFLDWWNSLASSKQVFLRKKIKALIIFNHLREAGRWLGIKHINEIRTCLLKTAEKECFPEKELIFFSSLLEIKKDQINKKRCLARKKKFEQYKDLTLPSIISSFKMKSDNKVQAASAGRVKGLLIDRKKIDEFEKNDEEIIMYTQVLSPDLLVYLDRVKGIVSESGSLLSHLAIVAREKNVPVLIGLDLEKSDLKFGDRAELDSSSREIRKIKL